MPGRTPPKAVLAELRSEVGFCCPVEGCGNPYLTWHHFDPPWRIEEHHRPEGMIALCHEHATKADFGSFTDDQLRELKRVGRSRAQLVRGRFDWMRNTLLALIGGNFYYEQLLLVEIGTEKCVWFKRDPDGYLLLNVVMPTVSPEPRARIDDNVWSVPPTTATEVICPPSGKLVQIAYTNGDKFRAEFYELPTEADLLQRYADHSPERWITRITFPLTVVEVSETAAGTNIEFGPEGTRVGGITLTGGFWARSAGPALHIGVSPEDQAKLFHRVNQD